MTDHDYKPIPHCYFNPFSDLLEDGVGDHIPPWWIPLYIPPVTEVQAWASILQWWCGYKRTTAVATELEWAYGECPRPKCRENSPTTHDLEGP